ncbi:hypothetical protein C8R31_11153 [Nitrosospira sp. Nsp2]|nr:hypothetical protein C8R31_11153 [Nitrosospira sp. Nsp2]
MEVLGDYWQNTEPGKHPLSGPYVGTLTLVHRQRPIRYFPQSCGMGLFRSGLPVN